MVISTMGIDGRTADNSPVSADKKKRFPLNTIKGAANYAAPHHRIYPAIAGNTVIISLPSGNRSLIDRVYGLPQQIIKLFLRLINIQPLGQCPGEAGDQARIPG